MNEKESLLDIMSVEIKKDASEVYYDSCWIGGTWMGNKDWIKYLKTIEGTRQYVDDEYLFDDQLSIYITPYELKDGRKVTGSSIDENLIERIFNDKRIGRGYCYMCHRHSPIFTPLYNKKCLKCGSDDFTPFSVNFKVIKYDIRKA